MPKMPNDSAVIAKEQIPVDVVTDPVWIRIRDLIYQVSGIYQAENKFYLLVSRCNVRMKAVGSRTPREYLDYLTARPNRDSEMRNLLNEITIGETCLFRSMPQVEALRKVVIPALVEVKKKLSYTKLRFWSAGCSTGEESYTLAMLMIEDYKKGATCDKKCVGSAPNPTKLAISSPRWGTAIHPPGSKRPACQRINPRYPLQPCPP